MLVPDTSLPSQSFELFEEFWAPHTYWFRNINIFSKRKIISLIQKNWVFKNKIMTKLIIDSEKHIFKEKYIINSEKQSFKNLINLE